MKNKYGVEVKECCASCQFKDLTRTSMRYCRQHKKKVSPHAVCGDWTMSDIYKQIGKTNQ